MNKLNILLVEDNELLRLGSKMILDKHKSFHVIAEASTESDAIEQALSHKPDVVLMDINLADGNGIHACGKIVKQLPGTKVIMITSHTEDHVLFESIKAGAFGYILKPLKAEELLAVVEQAQQGKGMLDPTLTGRIFGGIKEHLERDEPSFSDLKTQELRILAMIREGKTNKEIATMLSLSDGTVRNYVSGVLTKLGVENRTEAAAFAVTHNLDAYLPADWQSNYMHNGASTHNPRVGKEEPLKW